MKVVLTKEMKQYITLAQLPYVKQIIADLKEDDGLKGYAEMAARTAGGNDSYEILKATAEIALNENSYDAYCEGSGHLGVYIKVYAFNQFRGFFDIGVCLTDLWQLDGENTEEIKRRMFINHYKR